MSNISDPTSLKTAAGTPRFEGAPRPVAAPAPQTAGPALAGAAQTDRLAVDPQLAVADETARHQDLMDRVRALKDDGEKHPYLKGVAQEYQQDTKPAMADAKAKAAAAMHSPEAQKIRKNAGILGTAATYLGDLGAALASSPQAIIGNIQGMFSSGSTVVTGVHAVNAARKEGELFGYLGEQVAGIGAKAKGALGLIRAGKLGEAMQVFSGGQAAESAAHAGFLGFARAARADGHSVVGSVVRGLGKSVDAGGGIPELATKAAEVGGKWGKAMLWAGRLGRVAPLLNVPLAIFDVRDAWKTLHDPKADTREKVAKTGTAALTSVAGGLAIAGLLTPPPLDVALLGAAGIVGLGSLVWGAATSKVAVDIYQKAGSVIGDAASATANALGGAAKSVTGFVGGLFG